MYRQPTLLILPSEAGVFKASHCALEVRQIFAHLFEDLPQVVGDHELAILLELIELGSAKPLKVTVHLAAEQCRLIGHFPPDTLDTPEGLHEGGHMVEQGIEAGVRIVLIAPIPLPGIVQGA